MDQLLQDEGLRIGMGEAGRKHVEEHYGFELYPKKLMKMLSEMD